MICFAETKWSADRHNAHSAGPATNPRMRQSNSTTKPRSGTNSRPHHQDGFTHDVPARVRLRHPPAHRAASCCAAAASCASCSMRKSVPTPKQIARPPTTVAPRSRRRTPRIYCGDGRAFGAIDRCCSPPPGGAARGRRGTHDPRERQSRRRSCVSVPAVEPRRRSGAAHRYPRRHRVSGGRARLQNQARRALSVP
jgi:hypothetical protein